MNLCSKSETTSGWWWFKELGCGSKPQTVYPQRQSMTFAPRHFWLRASGPLGRPAFLAFEGYMACGLLCSPSRCRLEPDQGPSLNALFTEFTVRLINIFLPYCFSWGSLLSSLRPPLVL